MAANDAAREAIATTPNAGNPLLAPQYSAITGQNLRGFGWDIDTWAHQEKLRRRHGLNQIVQQPVELDSDAA